MTDLELPPASSQAAVDAPLTERDILALLAKRYGRIYDTGFRYATARHVRSAAGFDARRTADLIVMDLWPSRLAFHGHEIKVSRSDWLVERRDPGKAREFTRYMDFWWLVVASETFVRDGELPDDWGLMAVRGGRLAVLKEAPRLTPEPMPRTMFAALLRATIKTAGAA